MMATMRCDEELIQLYVDGVLHPAEAALVEAHLQECRACRRRAGFYKSLYWDLSGAARLAPEPAQDPDALAEQLLAEYRRHRRPAAHPARVRDFSVLWLTANPTFARPARTIVHLGHIGAGGLWRAVKRRWLRRKGGD